MCWSGTVDNGIVVKVNRSSSYPILFREDKFGSVQDLFIGETEPKKVFIVSERNVSDTFMPDLTRQVKKLGCAVVEIVLDPGEKSKSWGASEHLIRALRENGAERRSVIIGLGGGVICDLVGFVAASFMRSIPYVLIPTSLIGQLDAAIGGKTGIDFDGVKNLVGSFYHPSSVLIDNTLLATLSDREMRSGLAEAIKVGVLYPELFELLEAEAAVGDIRGAYIKDVVRLSVYAKLDLLASDPFETSLFRLLNLGHLFGHALESATGFEVYRHGEAVAIGMGVATRISAHRGLCDAKTLSRILRCIEGLGLETELPHRYAETTWNGVDDIRRIRNGRLLEVLPVSIGRCEIVDEISRKEFYAAIGL